VFVVTDNKLNNVLSAVVLLKGYPRLIVPLDFHMRKNLFFNAKRIANGRIQKREKENTISNSSHISKASGELISIIREKTNDGFINKVNYQKEVRIEPTADSVLNTEKTSLADFVNLLCYQDTFNWTIRSNIHSDYSPEKDVKFFEEFTLIIAAKYHIQKQI